MTIESILRNYPKSRPPLPEGQQRIYEKEYLENREGKSFMSGLSQKMESWMHLRVKKYMQGHEFLEIGAGTLNHIRYLDVFKVTLDVIEPQEFLYRNSPDRNAVRTFHGTISEIKSRYDTIYSIAALEHITDLPHVIARSGMLLNKNGVFLSAVPAEGGFLWGLSWRVSTGLAYKLRTGFSYRTLMRHEHVNNFDEICAITSYFYKQMTIDYFPIHGKHFSLYAMIRAGAPALDRCEKYIEK